MHSKIKYVIESAGYEIPVSQKPLFKLLNLLPGHLFFSLSKLEENGDLMPISSLHGLATRIYENDNAKKEILPIGNQKIGKLVLYHLFNHRGYLEEIKKQPEREDEILKIMQADKEKVGLTETEDRANVQALEKVTQGNGDRYWLSLDKRRTVYGDTAGEEHALELWKVLNDFKALYNQNPNDCPWYGLGIALIMGKAPLNSNAAFTTFAYLAEAPTDKFPYLWTPGLGGLLIFPQKLQFWLEQCQAIKSKEAENPNDTDKNMQHAKTSPVLSPTESLEDANVVENDGISFFVDNFEDQNNALWDKSENPASPLEDSSYFEDFSTTRPVFHLSDSSTGDYSIASSDEEADRNTENNNVHRWH